MYLNESDWQFTIVTAHSHGGSSLREGEAEMMVHLRLLVNDDRGVGQALDDFHQVTPRFFIISDTPTNSSTLHRRLANVIQYPMQTFYMNHPSSPLPTSFSPLQVDLPYNIRMISLKQRDAFVCIFLIFFFSNSLKCAISLLLLLRVTLLSCV